MKKPAIGGLFAALLVASGCGGNAKLMAAGADAPSGPCNPIAQTGCPTSEKCTWIVDQDTPTIVGHIGCVALTGTEAADGTACTGGPGVIGFDNCVAGDICVNSLSGPACEKICDP